jgi:hypothetical protein
VENKVRTFHLAAITGTCDDATSEIVKTSNEIKCSSKYQEMDPDRLSAKWRLAVWCGTMSVTMRYVGRVGVERWSATCGKDSLQEEQKKESVAIREYKVYTIL